MDLLDLQKKVKSIDFDKMMDRAVMGNKEEILDSNTAQLSKGKDSLGQFLDEYTLAAYAQFKKSLGSEAPLGIPDLKLDGDFYSGFTLQIEGEDYRITSEDDKTVDLTNRYGADIFGLTEERLQEIRPLILESLLIQLRNELLR